MVCQPLIQIINHFRTLDHIRKDIWIHGKKLLVNGREVYLGEDNQFRWIQDRLLQQNPDCLNRPCTHESHLYISVRKREPEDIKCFDLRKKKVTELLHLNRDAKEYKVVRGVFAQILSPSALPRLPAHQPSEKRQAVCASAKVSSSGQGSSSQSPREHAKSFPLKPPEKPAPSSRSCAKSHPLEPPKAIPSEKDPKFSPCKPVFSADQVGSSFLRRTKAVIPQREDSPAPEQLHPDVLRPERDDSPSLERSKSLSLASKPSQGSRNHAKSDPIEQRKGISESSFQKTSRLKRATPVMHPRQDSFENSPPFSLPE